ncbi:hypothetical protein O0I10_008899 [Lichtheimia ornata]|uniref:Uncharacterized protein n=1 Tax=Lichtheimia ornata TaxID=688661 RepID=A0AAD7UXQ3_9FUNG|nr:uncharacterized protein O0I10_008899 [Lichtheimia ornata]KAJ8655407.1 hypothetical protein O0I10_008899 [Lichtheimia ornata]
MQVTDGIHPTFHPRLHLPFITITMGLFDHFSSQHEEVVNTEGGHEGKLSHELIAAAASYEAAKAYNKHCEENGEEPNHAKAKEFMAAIAGGFIDKMIETKGLDYLDSVKAKKHAEDSINEGCDQHYSQ